MLNDTSFNACSPLLVCLTQVTGDFHVQDAVSLCDADGVEFARGLINFSAEEVSKVRAHMLTLKLEEMLGLS